MLCTVVSADCRCLSIAALREVVCKEMSRAGICNKVVGGIASCPQNDGDVYTKD
jgi:hypothetical protein